MKLSFYAKPGHVVHWPGMKTTGQVYAYVGRDFVPGDKDKGTAAQHPASKDPVCVESESFEGQRFAKLCRRDDAMWPADKETATHCNRDLVPVELVDGEWIPKSSVKKAKAD